MDVFELMQARRSVRRYLAKPIPEEARALLDAYAAELNAAGDLNIRIVYDEPKCFDTRMAHYGHFENCANYISMAGKKAPDLDERCGYYGELLVLKAQELGLNTCWAALSHGKSAAVLQKGEREAIVIALGYGQRTPGPRPSKTPEEVSNITPDAPEWFRKGVEAALLAPTAINQQKFRLERQGDAVSAKTALLGPCLKIDLGIVKCHFELGAGKENFSWK